MLSTTYLKFHDFSFNFEMCTVISDMLNSPSVRESGVRKSCKLLSDYTKVLNVLLLVKTKNQELKCNQ